MPSYFLVLVAPKGQGDTLESLAAGIGARPAAANVLFSVPVWLAEGEAVEVAFDAPGAAEAAGVRALMGEAGAGLKVDVCVVPAQHRRKRLLIADMDSTIIEQECIDEMADALGIKPKIAAITERAMRGELDFEAALRERLGLLAGLGEDALDRVWRERLTVMPGARELVATMRANGAYAALVSGGFTYFTGRVAGLVGFDENRANTLEVMNGRLTGSVVGPVLGREAKLATLEQLTAAKGLDRAETLAVGDGANDLAMIRKAGLGVAYRAKPVVAAEAAAAITHGDLTALLYLQGYRAVEIVRD